MKRYVIQIPAVLDSLRIATSFTDAVLSELPDVPGRDSLVHDLGLVVCEALTNAIRHGDAEKPVLLDISFESAAITISVTDYGAGFDPDEVSLPDFDGYQEGGYGVFIMKEIMDDVRYEKTGNGNTLILTRKLR